MLMIDLFSGLGGASEAFVQHPKWDVVRVEISEHCSHVPGTIIGDVMDDNLITSLPSNVDVLWMSPPCTEFSTARRPQVENPSLDLVKRCIDIVNLLEPSIWVLENVKGSIKHLTPILGEPRLIIRGTYVLWGNFPLFNVKLPNHSKMENDTWSSDPLRPQRRAYVPFEISEALRQSIQYQTKLEMYQSKQQSKQR